MHARKLAATITLASLLVAGGTATSAQAATGYNGLPIWNIPPHHGSFTYGLYDYQVNSIDVISKSGQTCYGHSDLAQRRAILCPWCTWYWGWIPHCTQV